jgi:SPP1 gp7 family putative phage head morphogenesis protein
MSDFKEFWKHLSGAELRNIRAQIAEDMDDGVKPKKTIASLSRGRKKLKEDWKAERVYRTEAKKIEVKSIKASAKKFGANHFKVFVEPKACDKCVALNNKVFTTDYLKHRQIVPAHPQCRCQLLMYNPISKSWNVVNSP